MTSVVLSRKQYAAMSERERVITLLHWYNTPQSGVIDHEAWIIAHPIIDELMFRLASLDSGKKINVAVSGSAKISFFGVERDRYHLPYEISDLSLKKKEAGEKGRATQRRMKAEAAR